MISTSRTSDFQISGSAISSHKNIQLTGEITAIVVFVAVLPYSQYIYAEGMVSTAEPQWIEVNNHALDYFCGVPTIVVTEELNNKIERFGASVMLCIASALKRIRVRRAPQNAGSR